MQSILEGMGTYLDRAEDPENQRLQNDQCCVTDTKGEVNANVLADVGVSSRVSVDLCPILEPEASACRHPGLAYRHWKVMHLPFSIATRHVW